MMMHPPCSSGTHVSSKEPVQKDNYLTSVLTLQVCGTDIASGMANRLLSMPSYRRFRDSACMDMCRSRQRTNRCEVCMQQHVGRGSLQTAPGGGQASNNGIDKPHMCMHNA